MAFLLSSLITNNWFNFVLKSLYVFFSNRDNFQVTYLSIYLSVHLSVTSEGVLIPAPHPRIKIKRGSETNLERKRFTKNGWDEKGEEELDASRSTHWVWLPVLLLRLAPIALRFFAQSGPFCLSGSPVRPALTCADWCKGLRSTQRKF